ncbi:hypothetical protein BJ508DRAFT_378980 [Ascobolus immersus RN42]|uniref:SMP-LTD domain-containing protein n=1 Tax=Ascobolus immersus RN42 TaxID=1160509 RepID=A0A3N4HXW1_ASCIM|nr:hypothetical protein BJ508DRAFT_378980 [Ascobolus immersus RN42]
MGFLTLLYVYLLGGITFIPLCICAVLLHAHLTFPRIDATRTTVTTSPKHKYRVNRYRPSHSSGKTTGSDSESEDDETPPATASGGKGGERSTLPPRKKKNSFGSAPNTAQGYFAVTREFVPGGINGKPPEKIISVQQTTLQREATGDNMSIASNDSTSSSSTSASTGFGGGGFGSSGTGSGFGNTINVNVGRTQEPENQGGVKGAAGKAAALGQNLYGKIFKGGNKEDGQQETIKNGKGKRGRNVFYVVLRLGHLIFFDDESQTDVRYVLPLSSYIPTIYSDESPLPEGELFIRRNAICLRHKLELNGSSASLAPPQSPNPDAPDTKPYYFFSESSSNKEDFYFALLAAVSPPPVQPLQIHTPDLISLMQRLHLSESHMETRWLNALLGRMFLSICKTPAFEAGLKAKIAKKMSRVNKPGFLSAIELRSVNIGGQLPYILRPKMRELGVEGGFVVEADCEYKGGATVEISTIATLSLGSHIRPREVSLILSVTLRRLSGHMLLRIKPPPSNRLWFTFEHPPKIDLEVKPVVSSRQITYGVVLRAIESRIKEVVMETLVGDMWDDVPFWTSEGMFRGGIWGEPTEAGADEEALTDDQSDRSSVSSAPILNDTPGGREPKEKGSRSTESLPVGVGAGTTSVGMGREGRDRDREAMGLGREGSYTTSSATLGTAAMGGRGRERDIRGRGGLDDGLEYRGTW